MVDKGGHRHFMAKEIHEQPEVVGHTLSRYLDAAGPRGAICRTRACALFAKAPRLTISACGTAYLRRPGRQILVREAGAACRSKSMSPPSCAIAIRSIPKAALALFVSQSGETADTLAALRDAKAAGQTHRSRSSTCRKARSRAKPTSCCRPMPGPEIGVASTKAFTCQLAVLAALAIAAARARGTIDAAEEKRLCALAAGNAAPHGRSCSTQEAKIEALGRGDRQGARRALSRPRRALPARARRRAEAEGNLLHPRRRLCRRRDEARPDRADRRERAGHRASRRTTRCSRRPSPTCRK